MADFKLIKLDEEQRMVFGWAQISLTSDGKPVEDLQGDLISPEELEKAFYRFMEESRKSGVMHQGGIKGEVIEMFVPTEDKLQKMGIPKGVLPMAAWIGVKVLDESTWKAVKSGELSMFSIQATVQRVAA